MRHIIIDHEGKKYKVKGGFIGTLLASLAGAVLPSLVGSLFHTPNKSGNGYDTHKVEKKTKAEIRNDILEHMHELSEDVDDEAYDDDEKVEEEYKISRSANVDNVGHATMKPKKGGSVFVGNGHKGKKGGSVFVGNGHKGKKGGSVFVGNGEDKKKNGGKTLKTGLPNKKPHPF